MSTTAPDLNFATIKTAESVYKSFSASSAIALLGGIALSTSSNPDNQIIGAIGLVSSIPLYISGILGEHFIEQGLETNINNVISYFQTHFKK